MRSVLAALCVAATLPVANDSAADFATYVEWPHIDDTFRTVYASMPGYRERRAN